jgi:hypothetical protein
MRLTKEAFMAGCGCGAKKKSAKKKVAKKKKK